MITGAAMGMGRVYAERAVAEGAETVILWDINKEALSDTTKALRVHADNTQEIVPMLVDIGQRTAIEKAAANVMENHGGVDIIINNAGVVRGTYFWEHENERDTEFIMKINALAPMFITHEFLSGMISGKRPSRIVNIASATVFSGSPLWMHYVASKGAVIGMTRVMAREVGPQGVTVNAIAPGFTLTEASLSLMEDAETYGVDRGAIKRASQPEDIVGTAIFLAGEQSGYITGQTLVVDGGKQFI